jgi:hypothetical protein
MGAQVRLLIKGAQHVLHPTLLNTLPVFYDNLAEALTPNHPRSNATSNNDIAAAHGNERARMTSYEPEQIVHEYQLFRDAFSRVADEQGDADARRVAHREQLDRSGGARIDQAIHRDA